MKTVQLVLYDSESSVIREDGQLLGGVLRGVVLLVVAIGIKVSSGTAAMAVLAVNPAYEHHQQDYTWELVDQGRYKAPISAVEDYANELWERPIEDGKFSQSVVDDVVWWTSTGKYYGYGDLKQAAYAFDDQFIYVQIEVVGGFVVEPGKSPDFGVGLKGRYYYYFGNGDNRFAINIDNGTSLSSSWSGSGVKMYRDGIGDSAYGSGFDKNYDNTPSNNEKDFTSFSQEITNLVDLYGRRNNVNSTVELALRISSLSIYGWALEDFFSLDFSIIGVAVSNPSSVSDLFANDNFRQAPGQGQEYDTMFLEIIPEPGTGLLLAVSTVWYLARRRRGD